MIKNHEDKMEKMQESTNKEELTNNIHRQITNKHIQTNNTITVIKNSLEGTNRIYEA